MLLRHMHLINNNRGDTNIDMDRQTSSQQQSLSATATTTPTPQPGGGTDGSNNNTTTTTTTTTGNSTATRHPEALPSKLSSRFKGPCIGTAMVDESCTRFDPSLVEMVTPDASPLLDRLTLDYIGECERQMQGGNATTASTTAGRLNGSLLSRSGRLSTTTRRGSVGSNDSRSRKNVLKQGGYLIFTDEYLRSHPFSPIASITQEFELVNPRSSEDAQTAADQSALDERKKRLETLKKYIQEVEKEHRPLFRMKTAEDVYGSSTYMTSEGVQGAPDVVPVASDDDVYVATSLEPNMKAEAIRSNSNSSRSPHPMDSVSP